MLGTSVQLQKQQVLTVTGSICIQLSVTDSCRFFGAAEFTHRKSLVETHVNFRDWDFFLVFLKRSLNGKLYQSASIFV